MNINEKVLCQTVQKYPQIVEIYQKRYEKMATPEYRAELINFAKSVLHDPIENLNWKNLLDWEHRHLKYTREELPKPRAELPIQIIHQSKGAMWRIRSTLQWFALGK
ncbi:MAG: hypothetical protein QHH17_05930 [Candidatus Bathyarchaeota archaeon]|nr:hypothetical protein [Candidatus Bathyarchaeota archaeon]